MHLRPACLLLFILVTTCSLSGIEIFLKNGDRLQGELIVESDDHLTILHPILGEIEIAKDKLAEWPITPKPVAPIVKVEPKPASPPKPPKPETKEPEKIEPAKDPGFPEIAPIVKQIPTYVWNSPKELIQALQRMNSKVGFSLTDRESRRDQTDIRFFYNSRWKNGKSEYRFDTDYRFRKTDGDVSEDRYNGVFRFRRQQQRDLFIQASSSYRRDPIREINHWAEQGFGGGWKKKVSQAFEYSMGGEASVKYEDFDEGSSDIGGFEFITSLFQDSVYEISKSYQVVQEAEYYIAPDDSDNWGYRLEVKLDGKITSGFSVRVGYEYSFDNIVPRNVPQKETLFSSSLLYTF